MADRATGTHTAEQGRPRPSAVTSEEAVLPVAAPLTEMLSAVVEASHALLAERDWQGGLRSALAILGERLGVDCVYVVQRLQNERKWVWRQEWNRGAACRRALLPSGAELREEEYAEVVEPLNRGLVYQPLSSERTGHNAELNHQTGVKSDLLVPVRVGGQTWGCLGFNDCRAERRWTESEIDVLRAVASSVASAVERAETERAHAETLAAERAKASEERAAELAKANNVLRRASERLVQAADAKAILPIILAEVCQTTGALDGAIYQYEEKAGQLRLVSAFYDGVPADSLPGHPFGDAAHPAPVSDFPAWARLIREGKPFFTRVQGRETAPPSGDWHRARNHQAILQSALAIEGQPLGLLGLAFRDTRELTATEREMFNALSQQVTLALQLHRLSEAAREEAVQAALVCEREKAAQERATELAKANEALRRNISRLAEVADVEAALVEAVRTAAEVIDAPGGALGIFLPEERGFRNLFQVVDGQARELGSANYASRLYSLDEEPIRLAYEQFQSTNTVLWCPLDSPYLTYDSREILAQCGLPSSVLVAVKRGSECIGYLSFSSRQKTDLALGQSELLKAVADQISLMLELSRLARASEQASVARERESAAQQRSAELAKANDALQTTIDALSEVTSLDQIVPRVLQIGADTFGANSCALYTHQPSGKIRLRYWFWEGKTLLPEDLLRLDPQKFATVRRLADGFDVPDAYLGGPASAVLGSVVLDHADGTAVPEFDDFAFRTGQELELNIGVASGGVRAFTLCVFRRRTSPFAAPEIALAEALAKQLGLAMETSRLAEEARDAAVVREREGAAQERAAELAKANEALRLRDRLLTTVAHSMRHLLGSEDFPSAVRQALRQLGEATALSRIKVFFERPQAAGKELAHELVYEWWAPGLASQASFGLTSFSNDRIAGMLETIRAGGHFWYFLEEVPEEVRADFARVGVRSVGAVPIFAKGDYLGLVAFDDCVSRRQWSESEVDALTVAAQSIGAALYRHELERAARQHAAELTLANDSLQSAIEGLARLDNLDGFLAEILGAALQASGAQTGAVALWEGDFLRHAALIDRQGLVSRPRQEETDTDRVLVPEALRLHAERLLVSEENWIVPPSGSLYTEEFERFHREGGNQAVRLIPLRVQSRLLGWLGLGFAEPDPPPGRSFGLLRVLAEQMTMGVETLRLSKEAERQAAEAATLEERNRIARELHDTLAQSFTGVLMQLQAMEQSLDHHDSERLAFHLRNATGIAQSGLAEARRSVKALRPAELETGSLAEALKMMAHLTEQQAGVPVTVQCEAAVRFPAEHAPEILRIAQEAVTNAVKHARAERIGICCFLADGVQTLTVSDDGRGFQPEGKTEGFGLIGMKERAAKLGGTLRIDSGPAGTTVRVSVPGGNQR